MRTVRTRVAIVLALATTGWLVGPLGAPATAAPPTGIRLTSNEVAENQPAGTVVGRIVVRDRDRKDRHRVRLVRGAADNASFRVRGSTLVTRAPLDFEADRVLRVRLRATDLAGNRVVRGLKVRVLDVDDSGQCGDCGTPPVAVDDVRTTLEDTTLLLPPTGPQSLVANDTDPDGDDLTVTAVSAAVGGTVDLAGGSVRFAPTTDFCGTGGFDYTVSDGHGGSDTGTVTIDIRCVYDGPQLTPDAATVVEDSTPTTIPVLANDTLGGGAPTVVSVTQPAHGTAAVAGGGTGVTYEPDADFCTAGGPADAFTYTTGGGLTSSVAVTVTCLPDSPDLDFSGHTVPVVVEDGPAVAVLPAVGLTDPDVASEIETVTIAVDLAESGDVLAVGGSHPGIASVWSSAAATLTLTGPAAAATFQAALRDLTFATTTSDLGNADRDLHITVTDDAGLTRIASETVDVTAVNDAPEITAPGAVSVDENGSYVFGNDVMLGDPDIGGQSLDLTVSAQHGTIDLNGGSGPSRSMTSTSSFANLQLLSASYAPDADYDGPDTITIEVDDNGHTGAGGDQLTTFTIDVTVDGDNDAPVADDHSFDGVGNTALMTDGATDPPGLQVTVTGSLLDGAADPDDPASSLSAVAETKATDGGGVVTIEEDGEFSYLPERGCADSSDTFEYTITDGRSETPLTDAGSVTIDLAECVWYVDAAADVPAPGVAGTSVAPYRNFGSLNGAGDVDGTGDVIYLAGGDYPGLTLEDEQELYTERSGLVVGGHTLLAPDGDRDRSEIDNGLRLAVDNTIQGLDLGASLSYALVGQAFGSLVMNTEMIGDVVNWANAGISLDNGDVDLEVAELTALGGTDALYLRDVSGDLSTESGTLMDADVQIIDSPVDLTLGTAVSLGASGLSISGSMGGTKDFNGPVSGRMVSLSTNTGTTIRFDGGVDLTTFAATGGGTVAVTGGGNTLAGADAIALTVTDTEIDADGLTFESISSNGAVNGIRLADTGSAGGLVVTGSGGACSAADDTCTGGSIASSTGPGVLASNVGGGISIDRMKIAGGGDDGIRATSVADLMVNSSVVQGNGNASSEHGVELVGPTGFVSVESSDILDNHGSNLFLTKGSGAVVLDVEGSSFTGAVLGDGLTISGSGVAVIDVDLDAVQIADNHNRGLAVAASSGSPAVGVTMRGGSAVDDTTGGIGPQVGIYPDGMSTVKVLLNEVDLLSAAHDAVGLFPAGSSRLDATIQDTTIDGAGDHGIASMPADNASARVRVTRTTISDYAHRGLYLGYAGGAAPGRLDYTVTNSTVFTSSVDVTAGMLIDAGMDPIDSVTLCADLATNTLLNAGHPIAGGDVVFYSAPGSTVILPSWVGGTLSSYINGRNNPTVEVSDGRNGGTTAGTCNQPDLP